MSLQAMCLMWFRNPLLKRIAHWNLSVAIAPFYTWLYRIAVNTAKNYLVAQGRRPPSSDVDAIDAENFESAGALKEISNPENLMLSEELKQIVFSDH
jgi:RNA polymerase, sigma-24 subunit, RpoE